MNRIIISVSSMCVVLSGLVSCGNAHQSISIQDWQNVGTNIIPLDALEGEIPIKEIAPGTGQTVQVGDLVNIRISMSTSTSEDVWLWTGREPVNRARNKSESWGELGSPRLRKSLIGRQVGQKIEADLYEVSQGVISIPYHGFILTDPSNHTLDRTDHWPSLKISGHYPAFVQIEILNTCPARLLRRTAKLKQWGYITNMFEMNYDFSRQGTLRWSALDANCELPTGTVRFEIGPIYSYQSRSDLSLYNWENSYRELRPSDVASRQDAERARVLEEIRRIKGETL